MENGLGLDAVDVAAAPNGTLNAEALISPDEVCPPVFGLVEKGVELDSVDVVAPLENLIAKALVAFEGVSLLVGGLKENKPGFEAVKGATAESVGLKDGVEVVACATSLFFCLAKRPAFDGEEAGLIEQKLGLGDDSLLGWDDGSAELVEEGLKTDSDWFEEDPVGAGN